MNVADASSALQDTVLLREELINDYLGSASANSYGKAINAAGGIRELRVSMTGRGKKIVGLVKCSREKRK